MMEVLTLSQKDLLLHWLSDINEDSIALFGCFLEQLQQLFVFGQVAWAVAFDHKPIVGGVVELVL